MNDKKALKIARKYLSEEIELEVHSELPEYGAVYPYNPENEILISFSLFEEPRFGSTKFITVSKTDGTVRIVGHGGE